MTSDGHDIIYAGAGMIWGLATVARGIRAWREEHRTFVRTTGHTAMGSPQRMEFSFTMLSASFIALGCAAYLFLSVFRR